MLVFSLLALLDRVPSCAPLFLFVVVQVAIHRHGCCVLQRCLDAAGPNLRIKLIEEVDITVHFDPRVRFIFDARMLVLLQF